MRSKFPGGDNSSCSISKCYRLKKSFATITFLSELEHKQNKFILLVQTKEVIFMGYGRSTSSWKPRRWMRLDLIFMIRGIYINSNLNPHTKLSCSSRDTQVRDVRQRHLWCHHANRPNQHRNIQKLLTSWESQRKLRQNKSLFSQGIIHVIRSQSFSKN